MRRESPGYAGLLRTSTTSWEPVMGVFSWIRSRALPLYRSHTPSGIGRRDSLLAGPGRDSSHGAEIKRAAAEDVKRLEEDDKYFGARTPGDQEGDA